MNRLKDYFVSLENEIEEDNVGIDEIEESIENLDFQMESYFNELEILDNLGNKTLNEGLESLTEQDFEGLTDLEFISLEEKSNKTVIQSWWDDWFITRHRLVQGIIDILRTKKANIAAYRKKLEHKGRMISKQDFDVYQKNHQSTLVSIEKYWLFGNGKYPRNILRAIEDDYKDFHELLFDTPKKTISAFKDLERVVSGIKNLKGEDGVEYLDKASAKLVHPIELIPKSMPNITNRYLYRTVFLITPRNKDDKTFKSLSGTIVTKVVKGDWKKDTINAILTVSNQFTGLIGAFVTITRAVLAEEVNMPSRDLVKMHEYGNLYLDDAEAAIDEGVKYLSEMDKLQQSIVKTAMDAGEKDGIDKSYIMTNLGKYQNNLFQLLGKPRNEAISRQIKVAKGINYLLLRTIKR